VEKDDLVTHPICIDCAIQKQSDPDKLDHHACDGYGLIVDALAALTFFRVELGYLNETLHLCVRCSPNGLVIYWTRDLEEHRISVAQSG
jgi:hypothetical protein